MELGAGMELHLLDTDASAYAGVGAGMGEQSVTPSGANGWLVNTSRSEFREDSNYA